MLVENSNFLIVEKLKLILVVHRNDLTQLEIKKIMQSIKGNPYLRSDFSVLVDIRNAVIHMTEDDIAEAGAFIFENLQQTDIKKTAILVLTSEQTTKAVEFVYHYKQSSLYQVFNTLDAALSWLKIPSVNKSQIGTKLEFLKNSHFG